MSETLVELAVSRDARLSRSADGHPLVSEIVEALAQLSGEAHRDLVIERIARTRARLTVQGGGVTASPALREEVCRAFDGHRETAGESRALFRRRFGEGSHRWALTPAAMAFIAARGGAS